MKCFFYGTVILKTVLGHMAAHVFLTQQCSEGISGAKSPKGMNMSRMVSIIK